MTRDELTNAVDVLLIDAKPEARELWRSLLANARLGARIRAMVEDEYGKCPLTSVELKLAEYAQSCRLNSCNFAADMFKAIAAAFEIE